MVLAGWLCDCGAAESEYGQQLLYQAIANHHLAAAATLTVTAPVKLTPACLTTQYITRKRKLYYFTDQPACRYVVTGYGCGNSGSSYLRTSSQALQSSEVTESSKNKDLQHPIGCLTQIERPNHHIYVLIAIKYI